MQSSEFKLDELSSSSVSCAQFPQVSRRNWADWKPDFSIRNVISQLITAHGPFPSDCVISDARYRLLGRSGSVFANHSQLFVKTITEILFDTSHDEC